MNYALGDGIQIFHDLLIVSGCKILAFGDTGITIYNKWRSPKYRSHIDFDFISMDDSLKYTIGIEERGETIHEFEAEINPAYWIKHMDGKLFNDYMANLLMDEVAKLGKDTKRPMGDFHNGVSLHKVMDGGLISIDTETQKLKDWSNEIIALYSKCYVKAEPT